MENCLDVIKDIDNKSIDMILCDLPYQGLLLANGMLLFLLNHYGEQYKRIIKDNGAIVLTASQPFYKCFSDE